MNARRNPLIMLKPKVASETKTFGKTESISKTKVLSKTITYRVNSSEDTWQKIHNDAVEEQRAAIRAYDEDRSRKYRLEEGLCKYCYYIMRGGTFAGQMITHTNCHECGKEMVFPTTMTDSLCLECAKKLNLCKHCGATMD